MASPNDIPFRINSRILFISPKLFHGLMTKPSAPRGHLNIMPPIGVFLAPNAALSFLSQSISLRICFLCFQSSSGDVLPISLACSRILFLILLSASSIASLICGAPHSFGTLSGGMPFKTPLEGDTAGGVGSRSARPDGSMRLIGLFPTYRFKFVSPPAKPIGSSLIHRPLFASYQRLRLF